MQKAVRNKKLSTNILQIKYFRLKTNLFSNVKKILSSANFNLNFSYLRAKRALNEIFRRDK
ncbi:hypothetical protein ABHC20_08650, partial [Streptococcus mutans]